MSIHDRFRNDVAPRLLAKFSNGGVQSVVQVTVPNPNPLQMPTATEVKRDIRAVVKGVSQQWIAIDPNVVASDLEVIVAAVDYVPTVGAMLEINGVSHRVITVRPITAAGLPAVYKFVVR